MTDPVAQEGQVVVAGVMDRHQTHRRADRVCLVAP